MWTRGDLRGSALRVVVGGISAQLGLGCMYLAQTLTPAMLAEFGWSRGDFMAAGSPRTFVAALASPVVGNQQSANSYGVDCFLERFQPVVR